MVRETRYLWIGNLPHTIREDRILEHFKRYGKVQSVKILPKKEDESGSCATVAFIDIKSAAKAHNADNKIDDRTLKTDYYEPPASSTASSAIYIHERDDALVRPAPAPYPAGRTPRYGLSEERNYERPGHYYADREPYMRRPIGITYHDEDNYQGRAKSRDRYSRATPGNNYTENTDRNQNHFRTHNVRQHFDPQRYPVGDQYSDEREPTPIPPRLNRRTNATPVTPAVASVASPTTVNRTENRPRRSKRRSPSRTPSGSRSNSGSRSRSRSSSGSRSSSSSSKLRSSSSDSSGRSRSPSKSRSPVSASYGSQSNGKSSRLDRPSSAIANPSTTACFLSSSVNTPVTNCTSNSTQGSTPSLNCIVAVTENHCDREEKRPLGICVRNLPVRSTDTSLKDGLFHEYKKHGKVTMVKVIGQGTDRYAVVCFKKPEDVDKALEVSKDKLFFGCKIEVTAHEGLDAEDNEFRPLEAELDEFHPKATRTLFIGNLEKDIITQDLRKHFEQFGEIIEIDIKKQGTSTSYAFIQYADIASVVKAMRKLDGENLGANRIKLGFGKSMPTNCVWLDGIVESVSEKFLSRHFARFGIVALCAIDREKGHALVFYETVEYAQIAVSEMRGRILQGKKLQVDFASRECQTSFFEKLEMSGQPVPGDGSRPWDRRERRPEFEVVRPDDREQRVGFENRVYPRYEGQSRPPRGTFRGGQRAGFSSRGRGQNFAARYEVYHDEFGERRHRYNSREDSVPEVTLFDPKVERPKYAETPDGAMRKRNKLRNSISDQESHHSQSPPRSAHQSRSNSPVSSKERKPFKERLHHRVKSPGSHHSSPAVNSPCRDGISDDLDASLDYRDSRCKGDSKADDSATDLLPYGSSPLRSFSDSCEQVLVKAETDSVKSRLSLDSESADESAADAPEQGERKRRLLAPSNLKSGSKDLTTLSKAFCERVKGKLHNSHLNSLKLKVNCVSSDCAEEDSRCDIDCVPSDSANELLHHPLDPLYLKEKHGRVVQEQSSDPSTPLGRPDFKQHRSSSVCSETHSVCEGSEKSVDECGVLPKVKDAFSFNKLKIKSESVESNCVSLDPRKLVDPHSALQKCRRISIENDSCLPNAQGMPDSFLCALSPATADGSWRKTDASLGDGHFLDSETDSLHHPQGKHKDVEGGKKPHNSCYPPELHNRHSYLHSSRSQSEKRDNSPLSLPLPKFAASLRSPKSSPSVLTSPKNTTHSPRAGLSPSYAAGKGGRLQDVNLTPFVLLEPKKEPKDPADDKVNGATISPISSVSPPESQAANEAPESASSESVQSPKFQPETAKNLCCPAELEASPSVSPSRPSMEDEMIEERIKALDEKLTVSTLIKGATGNASDPVLHPLLKSQKSHLMRLKPPPTPNGPSEILEKILQKSSILDQDFQRLKQRAAEQIKDSEKSKDKETTKDQESVSPPPGKILRTKAMMKELSDPIQTDIQKFNQSSVCNTAAATALVAQGLVSPPSTPLTPTDSVLSPITPPAAQYSSKLAAQAYTPCSAPFISIKSAECLSTYRKDSMELVPKQLSGLGNLKMKDSNFDVNSSTLATSLKSPLHCPVDLPSQSLVLTSPPGIRREPSSPIDSATAVVCRFEIDCKIPIRKEQPSVTITTIPIKKEICTSFAKDHLHASAFEDDKKDFCDSKDPRLAFHEESSHWRENGSKDEIKVNLESCAKSFPASNSVPDTNASCPAPKKRVSSIDSTESESSKSIKSLESSRDSHEATWSKHEKTLEPEPKKPKLSKSVRNRSVSPPPGHHSSKKSDKKDRSSKPEKCKSSSKSSSSVHSEKSKECSSKSSSSSNSKTETKEKPKSEHRSKDEKRSKSKDAKDSSSLSKEHRTKSKERRNSDKEPKKESSHSSSSSKPKKDSHAVKSENKPDVKMEHKSESKKETKYESKNESRHKSKSEKSEPKNECENDSKMEKMEESSSEKKQSEKKSKKSSSSSMSALPFDLQSILDDEPVYFSMYDKVKARSSKTQTLKHQTNDLESMRQKFSKLKQSRARREEKSKSIDQDSDKDSDSGSHHSSESDSQAKSTKMKQSRKRKLVIESSSDDDAVPRDPGSRIKREKDFSDSLTDSDFDYNVARRHSGALKVRRKKTDIFNSDSSDSESTAASKSLAKKKSIQNRPKSRHEKSKKSIKSDGDHSEADVALKSKEREMKAKKLKKEKAFDLKQEGESMDYETSKRSIDDFKVSKKKSFKEVKTESEPAMVVKKIKSEHSSREKSCNPLKDKKRESSVEKIQMEDSDKHKTHPKKRKKSKKLSKNKEKRSSDKIGSDSVRRPEDMDAKASLPVLSPKPLSSTHEKQRSPPRLRAGSFSDNEISDFECESRHAGDTDVTFALWKQLDHKSDSNSDKLTKIKRKESSTKSQCAIMHSPDQDSSLPPLFVNSRQQHMELSDMTDSETVRDPTDCTSDAPSDGLKHTDFLSSRKDKDSKTLSYKSRHEDHSSKQDSKYTDTQSSSSKEEKKKKKSKKQSKERKKRTKEEKESPVVKADSPTTLPEIKTFFESHPVDDDSRLSDLRISEELPEETRHFDDEYLVMPQKSSALVDEGFVKKEEKLLERRFEEEAAKETRRLEAELLSTGRDSWHMNEEKGFDPEESGADLCDEKHVNDIDALSVKEENIFSGLDLHSSGTDVPQNETEDFLSGHSEGDAYKLDDKDANEMDDQRKMEDDMAVSALLQEMHSIDDPCAPELTKETDYLDTMIESHPDDTINYMRHDGENSLHIAESSPDVQGSESPDEKLESSAMSHSPSYNSGPPSLEISHIEDSVLTKVNKEEDQAGSAAESLKIDLPDSEGVKEEVKPASCSDFHEEKEEDSLDICESKPPVIDIPQSPETPEPNRVTLSPKLDPLRLEKDKQESSDEADHELVTKLTENDFEDVTLDPADKEDDDNPPILQPVESPRNLLSLSESKKKIDVCEESLEGNYDVGSIALKPIDDPVEKIEILTDSQKLLADLNKEFSRIPEPPLRTENVREYRNIDPMDRCSVTLQIPDFADQSSCDSLLMNNSEMYDNCNSFSRPLIKTYDSEEERHQNKYTSHIPNSIEDHQTSSYFNILNPSCETSVIQSTHNLENHAVQSVTTCEEQPYTETTGINPVSDINQDSSDRFLLDFLKPQASETDSAEVTCDVEKTKPEDDFVGSTDSKMKSEDSNISVNENNHSSHPTFEVPEINEQNEATEFNQDLFEHSSGANKDSKVPQLLSFSSDQLFNNLTNKDIPEKNANSLEILNKSDMAEDDVVPPAFDSDVKDDDIAHFDEEEDAVSSADKLGGVSDREEKEVDIAREEPLTIEESLDLKSHPTDADSVCSDTTDITIPDVKNDAEPVQPVPQEERVVEEIIVEEIDISEPSKTERPRRGRRPKTRKYMGNQKADVIPEVSTNVTHTRSSSRRIRQASSERTRRSLRRDAAEPVIIKEFGKKRFSIDEPSLSGAEDVRKEAGLDGEVTTIEIDLEPKEKSDVKHEEPKKRRGRKKKVSGDVGIVRPVEKPETKVEEIDVPKTPHRVKESRLLLSLSSEKDAKSLKDSNNTSNAFDVFEFCEEEEECTSLTYESMKEKLHDTTRSIALTSEAKHDKISDLKHDKVFEPKHERASDAKHEKVTESKHERALDSKHERGSDSKHERASDSKHERASDSKHERGNDHGHDKERSENTKPAPSEEKEAPSKEHHPEVKEQKRISITIRLHQKDGHDGTSPGTAEVVKTSEMSDIEELKQESTKTATKHDSSDAPYNGPCKSTRKSTRLMHQQLRSTVDQVIEDVVKGNNAKSNGDPTPTRATRRSRSNRRSEESTSRDVPPSESSDDATDDKNKNEPVFFIHDNAVVKDVAEKKNRKASSHAAVDPPSSVQAEPDKISPRVQSLRTFRMTRSTFSRLESSSKDIQIISSIEPDPPKKDTSNSKYAEEPSHRDESHRDTKSSDSSQPLPPLPILRLEINKSNLEVAKEEDSVCSPMKPADTEEDSDSRSSPIVLVDPYTGELAPVSTSYTESHVHSENNSESLRPESPEISSPDLATNSVSKAAATAAEPVSATSVIQESSKCGLDDSVAGRPPIVQNLRSRPVSLPSTDAESDPPPEGPSAAPAIASDMSVEPLRLSGKKTTVVTTANCLVPSSSHNTVTEPVSTICSVRSQTPLGQQSPVISRTACISSHERPIDHSKAPSQTVANYESSIRTSTVVTATTGGQIAPTASNVQSKCSTSSASNKSELPVVYTPPIIPPASVSEQHPPPSSSGCKPLPLSANLPPPPEHSSLAVASQDASAHSIASSSPSVHGMPPGPTAWSSSKMPPASRGTDSHAHVSTIQSTANPAAYPSKLDSRSSKSAHSHGMKNNAVYSQQPAFPMSAYDDPIPTAHSISAASSGGVIAELLQNSQFLQQHKEYFATAGQLQDRGLVQMVRPTTPVASGIPPDIAVRLGNPTPPHTPTPPVTSSNHSLPTTDLHHVNSGLHIRQPLMVPPHPSLGLHHADMAFVHQQMLYAAQHGSYPPLHADMRVQQDARNAMGMNARYGYHPMSSPDVGSNFKQPSQPRHSMDAKSEQKVINDLSKVIHEARSAEEKLQRKSMRSKKDYAAHKEKELKMLYAEDPERLVSSALPPHAARQSQHAHFPSPMLQISPRMVSPHDRTTDSPVIANLYNPQGRLCQIPLAGQVDDHKMDGGMGQHASLLYKDSEGIKPPAAHQTPPSTNPYHTLESVHSRQQLLGVPLGSSGLDGRSSNSVHSPNSLSYKKDSGHSQLMSMDKRVTPDHSKKVYARSMGHPSSISPGPVGLPPAQSPVPWQAVIQTHNSHSAMTQQPHLMMNDQGRRVNAHLVPPMGSEVPLHAPPPAHTMSQASNIPRGHPQTPPQPLPPQTAVDAFVLQRHPVLWQGILALKNDQATVQMHFVSGNPNLARASFPQNESMDPNTPASVRVSQRMRLEQMQLDGVKKKLMLVEEHCILIALPCGKDHLDVVQQSSNLRTGFITYLQQKQAAGIVNAPSIPGSQQSAFVVHIFPSCEFTDITLSRVAPDLLQIMTEINHLVIVIATV